MRPFIEAIGDMEDGQLVSDLTVALAHVTQEVVATRKEGKLTLEINILPNGENSVEVKALIKEKAPEAGRPKNIMFVDTTGALRRDNPNQGVLPLRDHGDNVKPIRGATE